MLKYNYDDKKNEDKTELEIVGSKLIEEAKIKKKMTIKSLGAPEKRSVPGQWVFRSIFGTFEVLLTVFLNSKMEYFKLSKSRNKNKTKIINSFLTRGTLWHVLFLQHFLRENNY